MRKDRSSADHLGSGRPSDGLGGLASQVAREVANRLLEPPARTARYLEPLGGATGPREAYAACVGRDVSSEEWSDLQGQTFASLLSAWLVLPAAMRTPRIADWLIDQADPLWRAALVAAIRCDSDADGTTDANSRSPDTPLWRLITDYVGARRDAVRSESANRPAVNTSRRLTHDYEAFLRQHNQRERRRRGVYYTPSSLVTWMVRNVRTALVEEFGRPHGWVHTDLSSSVAVGQATSLDTRGSGNQDADNVPRDRLRILDPAAGTGAFLVELIRQAHGDWREWTQSRGFAGYRARDGWNRQVPQLIACLRGFELLPPACAVAQLNVAAVLHETGFAFDRRVPLAVQCRDAMLGPEPYMEFQTPSLDAPHRNEIAVVIGNPPFAGISENNSPWISDLLRGTMKDAGAAERSSYFQIDGLPLRERKVWLNDDYIKFFRAAHWHVERVGQGIVALVTNHGYLDGATCRGMRASLARTFHRISIVDLHGNAKRRETTPDGSPDANLFAIEQGIAISLLRRDLAKSEPLIERCDLWGSIDEKEGRLDQLEIVPGRNGGTAWECCHATSPHYQFTAGPPRGHHSPTTNWFLPEVMPFSSTAPVTARDHFVVAFTAEELRRRMDDLRDPRRTDEWLRQSYFQRTRSASYPPGDTRGWKLQTARARAALSDGWDEWIRSCLYRPFDRRFVFWADWMIDWPRPTLTRQWDCPGNVALIARRQMLPNRECNFFWCADRLVLDGVIRSDNRGSESVFPLFVLDGETWRENFSPRFRDEVTRVADRGDARGPELTPRDLLAMLYATFHSPSYRTAFADQLRVGFPPVPIPVCAERLNRLILVGHELLGLHVGQGGSAVPLPELSVPAQPMAIGRGFPRYRDTRIWLSDEVSLGPIDERVWRYQVGAHQSSRKWLTDRKGGVLSVDDLFEYRRLVGAIGATIDLVREHLGQGAVAW